MRLLGGCLLAILLLPMGVNAQGEVYFPDRVFGDGKEQNDDGAKWYSRHLEAMKEPSLWKLSQKNRSARVYRFSWLPMFHSPVSVRITETPDGMEAQIRRLDGRGGYDPGKIAVARSKKLSKEQQAEFKRLRDRSKFWTLPTIGGGFVDDGDPLIIEGVEDGKYHIVDRNHNYSRAYFDLCQYAFLDLSGLDLRKVWKEYHHDEDE